MNDGSIPTSRLITIALWALTAAVGLAGWIVALAASQHLGLMLGLTACCLSATATVSHVRCTIYRATRYVRASIDAKDDGVGLRSL